LGVRHLVGRNRRHAVLRADRRGNADGRDQGYDERAGELALHGFLRAGGSSRDQPRILRYRAGRWSEILSVSPAAEPIVADVVDVLVPVALDQAYSYRAPHGLALAPGDFVSVPLGPRTCMGVVWGEGHPRPGLDNRLKEIEEKLDLPPLRAELRHLVEWV